MAVVDSLDVMIANLDIPQMLPSDFANPNFNPYPYDGADKWFDGRRETDAPGDLQKISQEVAKISTIISNMTVVHDSNSEPMSEEHTEDSSQDDRDSIGISNKTLHQLTPFHKELPVQKPACRFRSLLPPKPSVPGKLDAQSVGVPKPLLPIAISGPKPSVPAPFLADKPSVALHNGPQHSNAAGSSHIMDQRPKAMTPPAKSRPNPIKAPREKPHFPPALPKPVKLLPKGSPVPQDFHRRRPLVPVPATRKDEMNGTTKRKSVAAARAEEFFIHSLRQYPEDKAKHGSVWK